jgi:hypothetical protein
VRVNRAVGGMHWVYADGLNHLDWWYAIFILKWKEQAIIALRCDGMVWCNPNIYSGLREELFDTSSLMCTLSLAK